MQNGPVQHSDINQKWLYVTYKALILLLMDKLANSGELKASPSESQPKKLSKQLPLDHLLKF